MHWWADGGVEGYMVSRRDPKTGRHMCLEKNTCAVQNSDVLFRTDSYQLTPQGQQWLRQFFANAGAFAYAVYGHTDSRASDEYNMRLSQNRANAVAAIGRQSGAVVDRVVGFGERQPIAPNNSAANMQKNRRVEIVCYRYPNP
ncbi:MAG: OmpA family protein [Pseudomonadota bacterium]|nr:OmpA family protein [Pseudomonadota bacterium]